MCTVNIYELKTNLSKYLEKLEKGEEDEIIICRYDKKIAKISLYEEEKKKSIFGCCKHLLPDGFTFDDIDKGFEDIPEMFGY